MRKLLFIPIIFLLSTHFTYALKDCTDLGQNYDALKGQVVVVMDEWKGLPSNDPKKVTAGKALSELLSQGVKLENEYNDCLNSVKKINELIETYFDLGNDYFKRKQWDNAITQYTKVIELDPESYKAHYNIGSVYVNKANLEEALKFYWKSRSFARGKVQMQESKNAFDRIEKIIKRQKQEKSAPSNDPFSHLQYYLHELRIPDAWKKITKPQQVVVAVIDDGININHPDLTDHIWIDPTAPYGSSKIKDFVWDNLPDNLPTGQHGTMIAWIIWATGDNKKGIAGIAKNVLIMPLRVFDFKWNAREEHIINAMYFAINNWANIINLSLWQSQFNYSAKYDEVMRKAYENGVMVVIAAGNGDILSFSNNGINTTVNPISPVCNNWGNKKYSIGVESLDQKWVRSRWSNYGACVSFSAPGENIFSTSVSVFNKEAGVDYDTDSGTSFAAPMIAGIIALWYNKYGYVSPDIVYQSLNESMQMNEAGNYGVNASKYLDILESKKNIIQKEQKAYQARPKQIVKPDTTDTKKWSSLVTKKSKQLYVSDADFLAERWIISKRKNASAYKVWESVKRQEVVLIALKLLNIYLPEDYTCRWIYKDVTANKPNTWACQVVEMAVKKGVISAKWDYFKPEENISVAESLSMLMKAANIRINNYSGGEFEAWETNVMWTALATGIIESRDKLSPTKTTLRSDLFRMTRKIISLTQ